MLRSVLLAIVASVQAVYLSTLVGPMQSSPGATLGLSSIKTLDLDTNNVSTSYGFLGDASVGGGSLCQLSSISNEAPITTSSVSSNVFTVCSSVDSNNNPVKVLASGSVLGSSSYTVLGSTNAFEPALVQRITTDNGTNFYILTRAEPGNSTVWWIRQGSDLTVIQNGTEDGWVIQHIEVNQGSLMGIGNRFTNPNSRNVIWWGGRGLPTWPAPPQPYPGLLASNGNNLLAFAFSDPNTLWLVSGAAAAGGSPMLMMYIYNRQTLAWTIGGYYMFNATQPAPSGIYLGGRPPITKFLGVSMNAIMEYSIPPASGGGTMSSTLTSRPLLGADRGTSFRGLAVSFWTPIPTPSAAPSPTSTLSVSATASVSALPTETVSQSTTATRTPVIYGSAFPTFSAAPTYSAQPSAASTSTAKATDSITGSSTPTPSQTPTLSVGASPSITPSRTSSASPTPTLSASSTQTPTPTSSISIGLSPSQTATTTPSASPSSTATFVNATGAAMAASGTDAEALKLGFGIAVPLLIVGAAGIALFSLFKSGKLMIMLKTTPKYFKHGYGKMSYNSARAPRVPNIPRAPMQGHPVLRANPLNPPTTQMSYNSKILDQMRSQKVSVRQLVENQTVMMENGARTIIKTRVSFAPSLSSAALPVSPSVGTSV